MTSKNYKLTQPLFITLDKGTRSAWVLDGEYNTKYITKSMTSASFNRISLLSYTHEVGLVAMQDEHATITIRRHRHAIN